MFDHKQFRECIIEPVLSKLQVYSKDAEELLVFTCATESDGGRYLTQVKGPALGIYQMEPNTYTDIWVNFIKGRNRLLTLMSMHFDCHRIPPQERLIYDLGFATAMARIHYLRCPGNLPNKDDPKAMFDYYKKFYNTKKGDSKEKDAIEDYKRFIKG